MTEFMRRGFGGPAGACGGGSEACVGSGVIARMPTGAAARVSGSGDPTKLDLPDDILENFVYALAGGLELRLPPSGAIF